MACRLAALIAIASIASDSRCNAQNSVHTNLNAFSLRAKAIEWWANVSDIITIVNVTNVESVTSSSKERTAFELTCHANRDIRGRVTEPWRFRLELPNGAQESPLPAKGDSLLRFVAKSSKPRHQDTVFWVNLTKPILTRSHHTAFNNEQKILTTSDKILEVVNECVRLDGAEGAPKKRGVIISAQPIDSLWKDFVRTANSAYKETLTRQLHSKNSDDRCAAIYNLISYKSEETINLIQLLLSDTEGVDLHRTDNTGERQKLVWYPVRQTAYLALRLLEAKVERPTNYSAEVTPTPFIHGFENPAFFPYGTWKEIEKDW